METYLPYTRQTIEEDDIALVAEALRAELITRGPFVEKFEEGIAAYCGAKYAIAFNSGSTALAAACFAAQLSPKDHFFSTPNSFIASVGCARQVGIDPVFVDIDRTTGNVNLQLLEYNLNRSRTRGRDIAMIVHFSGLTVDMQQVDSLISHPETVILEDAAHALGASYSDGQKVGCCAWSQMTIFSLHPAKTITTGEGGIVTTNDENLAHRLRLYRNNGIVREAPYLQEQLFPGYYEVHHLTGNTNFTEMQGALGLSQLKKMDKFITKRRELVALYRRKLARLEHIRLFDSSGDHRSAHHLMVVQIDFAAYGKKRAEVMQQLHEKGIGTQVHYIPIYRHPCFQKNTSIDEYFPEMEGYYAQALTLPLYPALTSDDVERVCNELALVLTQ